MTTQWLRENGNNLEKAGGVDLANARNHWSRVDPPGETDQTPDPGSEKHPGHRCGRAGSDQGRSICSSPLPVCVQDCVWPRSSGMRAFGEYALGVPLQNPNQMDGLNVALVFNPLVFRALALGAFPGQLINPRLVIRTSTGSRSRGRRS
jgi:hypothetical protein